jgi:hypothetical protein
MNKEGPDQTTHFSRMLLLRHGQRHDLYLNPETGKKEPVPRHSEIDENLARHILKILT